MVHEFPQKLKIAILKYFQVNITHKKTPGAHFNKKVQPILG